MYTDIIDYTRFHTFFWCLSFLDSGMESILFEPLWHDEQLCIAIRGRMNKDAFRVVNTFPHRKFSRTHQCYLVPYSAEALSELSAFFPDL